MNMKVRKSVIAFLMATTMVGSTAVPAMAGQHYRKDSGNRIAGRKF